MEIDFNCVTINKNRGWRGLAEIIIEDASCKEQTKMIFSFSQDVWEDLILQHSIVIQDSKYYYVIKLNNVDCDERLPKPNQQRSVLIKNATLRIHCVNKIAKTEWQDSESFYWLCIRHFIKNRNNHTQSDWNHIGIRVTPII